jgi:hypothetical protein
MLWKKHERSTIRKLAHPLRRPLADRCSDYKPELDRLAEERKNKTEADKKAQLDRLMKDMSMGDKPDRKGENPFGPHPMHERVDL